MIKQRSQLPTVPLEWTDFEEAIKIALNASHLKIKNGSYRFILFAAVSAYTGLPANKIILLQWGDILSGNIFIERSNDKRLTCIPIAPGLRKIIAFLWSLFALPQYSDEERNFRRSLILPTLIPNSTKSISMQYLNRGLKELMRASGYERADISTHSFRKTYAKHRFEELGKSHEALVKLSKYLNHSSTSFTKKYLGL
jgi:integrase